MFRLMAQYVLFAGFYGFASVFIYLISDSAFYVELDEFRYLCLIVVGVVVSVLPAVILWVVGVLRHEPSRPLILRKHKVVTLFACLILAGQALQFFKDCYYKNYYGISDQLHFSGGSENFNVLFVGGREFCKFSTKLRAHFDDINGDGLADIVLGGSYQVLYVKSRGAFEGCPDLGG